MGVAEGRGGHSEPHERCLTVARGAHPELGIAATIVVEPRRLEPLPEVTP